jgi:hypothetical protein
MEKKKREKKNLKERKIHSAAALRQTQYFIKLVSSIS